MSSDATPGTMGGGAPSRRPTCPSQDSAGWPSKRPPWTDDETRAFIRIWGSDAMQRSLSTNYRTVSQFQWISNEMRARGYETSWKQCREKANQLRKGFKEYVGGNSTWGAGRLARPFFDELNRFLRIERNLVVSRVIGNEVPHRAVGRRRKEMRNMAGQGAKCSWARVDTLGSPALEEHEGGNLHFPAEETTSGTALSGWCCYGLNSFIHTHPLPPSLAISIKTPSLLEVFCWHLL